MNVVLVPASLFDDAELKRRAYDGLSATRQRKADAYRFEKDRRLALAAGVALDYCLRMEHLCERDGRFGLGDCGKPYLMSCGGLFFNLSHSGDFAVCAMAGQDLGVDIELTDRYSERLIRAVCTQSEAERIFSLDGDRWNSELCRIWTQKESFLKYIGTGLKILPKSLETDIGPEGALLWRSGEKEPVRFWQKEVSGHWLSVCSAQQEQVSFRILTREEMKQLYD